MNHSTFDINNYKNADISKAKHIVGYEPTHDIDQGMEEAIEWYIENIGKNNDKN